MSFFPIKESKADVDGAIEEVKAAPLVYSNPVSILSTGGRLPEKSESPELPSDVVEHLNGGRIAITVFTPFANVGRSVDEKVLFKLERCFSKNAKEYHEYDYLMQGMFKAITMIASRAHMISLSLNNVPQSYFYSVHGETNIKPVSPNIYKRIYVTGYRDYSGARTGFLGRENRYASYCAIISVRASGESVSTSTRLVIADKDNRKGHIDNLIKQHIYKDVMTAIGKVLGIDMNSDKSTFESVDSLNGAKVVDNGFISIRHALDDISGSGVGNQIDVSTPYLHVVEYTPDNNGIFVPLIAMLMASHAGDEYLPAIVSKKAQFWTQTALDPIEGNNTAWYALATSMMLSGLSPFYAYDVSKFNKPITPSFISYEERKIILDMMESGHED